MTPYTIQYDNETEDLLTRLLKIRNIDCAIDDFLDPSIATYWTNPFLLNDMDKAVQRIITALKNNEHISIFADYDVDGVTSSFLLHTFFTRFLKYPHVSVHYPDRLKDGYGIKKHHIDTIAASGHKLIITVDNGITAVEEALHAKSLGMDLLITDHHEVSEKGVPEAYAVVNPQVSPDYTFKWLCGAGVAFKLICAMMETSSWDKEKKNMTFMYLLPIVAIATVADCVPLVKENRVLVKKWLEQINKNRNGIPKSLKGLLDYLKITKPIDSFHIWFMIGPRINAGWRVGSPHDSLNILLKTGEEQLAHLDKLEGMNTERRKLQESAYKLAEQQVDHDENILIAVHDEFHEWIIWIVAGRLAEKYNKPTVVMSINREENKIVASLRGPDYFHVMHMLDEVGELLTRYGGHKQAWGMSCPYDQVDQVIAKIYAYGRTHVTDLDLLKKLTVDTTIQEHERLPETLEKISRLAPFGIGNEEPVFLIKGLQIAHIEKVGTRGNGHLKLHAHLGTKKITSMFWSKWHHLDQLKKWTTADVIGKIKVDDFNGGYFIDGVDYIIE
jgi:single-stranded-DNA-specific exonuclease